MADSVNYEEFQKGLGTRVLGRKLHHYVQTGSTNDVAVELAKTGAPDGTVIIADSQTQGQGRLNRKWFSPAGAGLWFTAILRPRVDPAVAAQITLLAAVAVALGIKANVGVCPGIKWPNDLLFGGKKICGILTEMNAGEAIEYVILGIGINVNLDIHEFSPDLQGIATSLSLEMGRPVNRLALLGDVLRQLDAWYGIWQREGFKPVRAAWQQLSISLKKHVKVDCGDEIWFGEAVDINDDGALILKTPGGAMRTVNFGEVSICSSYPGMSLDFTENSQK